MPSFTKSCAQPQRFETSTGNPLAFISQLPAQLQATFIQGFHQAFTLAIANSMLLGVGAAVASVVVSLLIKEIPLRTSFGARPAAEAAATPSQGVSGVRPALD